MRAHRHLALLAAGVFFSKEALAQIGSHTTSAGLASHSWSLSIIADGYVVPHAVFFVSPIIPTDRDWLHLEARYNYEDQSTGSLWLGHNFSGGRKLAWEVTPMIGGVFGNTTGIAPGFQASFSYKKFSLSSSGEYVFDSKQRSASFFYSWPQLTYSATHWLRAGLVANGRKPTVRVLTFNAACWSVSITRNMNLLSMSSMQAGHGQRCFLRAESVSEVVGLLRFERA
jgi:hypothetical protein